MASNNNLEDQVLTLFPDNLNNEITAADMRAYTTAIFGDKEVQIEKLDKLADLAFNNTYIYEGSLVVVYNDNIKNTGIYLSKENQPTLPTALVKLTTLEVGSGGTTGERGGIAYDITLTYYVGDIVSYDNGVSTSAFIASSNSASPAGNWDPADWDEIQGGGSGDTVTGTLDRDFGKLNAGTDVTGKTPTEMIEEGYIGEIVSTVSISQPGNVVYEKGNIRTNVPITSNITIGTGTLQTLEYLINSSVVETVLPPIPTSNTYNTGTIIDTSTFSARVTDTIGVSNSNNRTYTFVYPYYSGTDIQGVNDITNFTKDIRTKSNNLLKTFTSNNNVFYFCFPKSYGLLTSILDENGFETIGDWGPRDVPITGLDSSTQIYTFYEFVNITTTSTEFTFKR